VAVSLQPAKHVDTLQSINMVQEKEPADTMRKRVLSVRIDGQPINMELDTGAPCSIISAQTDALLDVLLVIRAMISSASDVFWSR